MTTASRTTNRLSNLQRAPRGNGSVVTPSVPVVVLTGGTLSARPRPSQGASAAAAQYRCVVPTVTFVYVVVAAVAVFVIAAVVVGREARRLDSVSPRSVYIPAEALEFVAEYLPAESQARLTPDELERLLAFHMRWLHAKGLQPTNVIDRRQDDALEVVITEDTVTGYLLGEADAEGIEILDDVDVVHVVEAHLAYFEAIGAVGPPAVEGDGR